MQTPAVESSVEHTSIGRIVVPPNVPPGFRLFYTTIDFDGRIDDRIRDCVRPAALSSCHQVHGAKVCKAPVHESECDAMWSDQKNTALAIKVAVCCFEVGEEVAAQFDRRFVDRSLGTKPHVDIIAFTEALLRDRGINNIVDTGLCTRCGNGVSRLRSCEVSESATARPRNRETTQPLFHSYRRDRRSGRNLAIVAQ